jgi:anaerobic magnesium-protoporphyrin IX monomethyl ester cyclase
MKKTKVLLFFPSYRSIEAAPPLALLALAPIAEQRGLTVDIVDSTIEPRYRERIIEQLDEALCVGISIVTGPMIVEAIEVARAVKAAKSDVPVILGGWHPSTLAEQSLTAPYIDVVVRGQGEVTFGEILDRLLAGETLEGIQGCSFRRPDGRIVHNPSRHTVNISELPRKSYHLIDIEPYAKLSGRRWIYYTSSHGCPYDCSFCSNASLYGRAWNALPAHRVVQELIELVGRFRLNLVSIVDDNFLVERKRGVEIAEGLLKSGVRFDWCIQTTANFLLRSSDDEMRLMRQGGLSRVFIGAESGSDDVLRSVNKVRFQGTRVLHDVAEKCHRAGITCTFSLIFGLPDETAADRRQTIAMIRQIKSRYPGTEFHSNIYTPYPGAPNFTRAVSMGLREPESLEQWAEFYPKFQRLPWIDDKTHRQIQRIREYIRIAYGAAPVRPRSSLRAAAHSLLTPIARARLNSDRYALPVELWALKSLSRLKNAIGLQAVRTHVTQS